jgi:hypothetical protein
MLPLNCPWRALIVTKFSHRSLPYDQFWSPTLYGPVDALQANLFEQAILFQ